MTPYEAVTNVIIKKLEEGVIPWQRPWKGYDMANSNFISKKPYRGINALITNCMGYQSPYWMTFNQIKGYEGAKLRKGSKAVPIIFSKWVEKMDDEGKVRTFPIVKRSGIFNLDQIEGLDCPVLKKLEEDKEERLVNPIDKCENLLQIIKAKHAKVIHDNRSRACYNVNRDIIEITKPVGFNSDEQYYTTLYHEIIHSTGHKTRLNREFGKAFGNDKYAKEELIAEIGASFLAFESGISNKSIDNSASYINGWAERFKKDSTLIVKAASNAEKAVKYLKGL